MTDAITATLPQAFRARTGGPSDDGPEKLVEQALGWTLVVLVAVLVTRLGLL